MWSYIVQLAGAIKRVHDVGQAAVRMIDVTKGLVTSKNRCVLFLALQYFARRCGVLS
jgi:hypothetical protein